MAAGSDRPQRRGWNERTGLAPTSHPGRSPEERTSGSAYFLFGSRACGDYCQESDWDVYVMVDKQLPFPERQNLASRIRWALAQQDMDGDVIIQDERTAREREMNPGYLTYCFVHF
ncbi:MAG: nucleotidyltransferase domain-containing protein [Anaerolineae bacterium]|nr:nucleotidyltransferase domain-containing protein [Anaerolineae bacterium]